MPYLRILLLGLFLQTQQPLPFSTTPTPTNMPVFTSDGKLLMPENYREWIFLSSGFDMSYRHEAVSTSQPTFDNIFVNPPAYKAFLDTGSWPEGTMLMLETRASESARSINQRGKTQSRQVARLEIHVKDSAHIPGGWGFFSFDKDPQAAEMIKRPARCYTCHEQHAAVDTTFLQFYPTLIDLAEEKQTLSTAYRNGQATSAKK